MDVRRFAIEHNTSGWSAESSIEGWEKAADGVLAHFVVDRDGSIFQCRPCNRTCGHAGGVGKSKWRDPKTGQLFNGLNSCAIGIEIANCADLVREVYPNYKMGDLAGKPIPRLKAAHKHGGPQRLWEVYPEAQIEAVIELTQTLVKRFNLDDVIGHEDCSPYRKVDPGPAFPLARVRVACGFPAAVGKL